MEQSHLKMFQPTLTKKQQVHQSQFHPLSSSKFSIAIQDQV